MIKIKEKLVKYNFSSRKGEKIKYITVHDTGNPNKGADAEAHFKLHDRADRGASAHYFVDDKQILRIIRDDDKSWHCGDGHGKYGITNENSIGIEMCINSDGDFNKTYKNTLDLVKHLMGKYNISIDKVVRHYDASRKSCPNSWSKNNWDRWDKFKEDLSRLDMENHRDYTPSITLLYKNVLQRVPDNEGLAYWNKQLNLGLSFGEVLKEWAESEEFKEKYLIVN